MDDQPLILVAEDDADIRGLVAFTLRRQGWRTAEAGDGVEALRKAQAEMPDLIVLDVNMPGLDGFAVCRILQAKGLAAPPVVFLTARAGAVDLAEGLEIGAADYVCKPFAVDDLLARVDATGSLPTRDHLTEVLEREIRTRRPFAVVLVEADHDADLHDIAHTFRKRAGVFDSIVPNGDHSLAVVLPRADIDRAQARADTLRGALTEPARFGVAAWEPGDDAESMLARAALTL
jgi:CheY-like chemotaxis protein